MSTRIAEPALWCLLTRLGENSEVFTAIINQERAWFFPGFRRLISFAIGQCQWGIGACKHRRALLPWQPVVIELGEMLFCSLTPSARGFKLNKDARLGENGVEKSVKRRQTHLFREESNHQNVQLALPHTKKKQKKNNKCLPPDSSPPDVSLEFHSKLQKSDSRKKGWGRGGGGRGGRGWTHCLAALALHLGTALTHLLKSHCVILL